MVSLYMVAAFVKFNRGPIAADIGVSFSVITYAAKESSGAGELYKPL